MGNLTVINVKDPPYSATGDGTTLDTVAVQAAADAVNEAGGGILYFPPGVYLIGNVAIRSNTWVLGAGHGAYADAAGPSVLKRNLASAWILRLRGVHDCWVSHLAFDLNRDLRNYIIAIDVGLSDTSTTVSDNPLGASAFVVNVDSTAGFPASGELLIDQERITYAARTATSFTGLGRGAHGTTGASHAMDEAVRFLSRNVTIESNFLYVSGRTTVTDDPLTAGATMINVLDTAQFPNAGDLQIEAETVSYTGRTATSFTGVTRGVIGTTAAAHALGTELNRGIRGNTLHAVLCQWATNVWIRHNRTQFCQLKLGNGTCGPNITIANNVCTDARNSAISAVCTTSDRLLDVAIVDNQISLPNDVGIYFGNDSNTTAAGVQERFLVRGNIIDGVGDNGGILGRLGISSRDWIVADNIVTHVGTPPPNTYGIAILSPDSGGALTRLTLARNIVKTVDLAGVVVVGAVTKLAVIDNELEDTRGISLVCASSGRILHDGIVARNIVSGGYRGVEVDGAAVTGTMGPIRIHDNILKNAVAARSGAGILIRGAAGLAADVELYGNRCYDDRGTKLQDYGIALDLGSSDVGNVRIHDNDLRGNKTAAIAFLNATSTGQAIYQNRGWVTEAQGTATIPSGSTSVVVNHGLSAPPAQGDIILTMDQSPAADPGYVFVASVSGAQLTIGCRFDPGEGGLKVAWFARAMPSMA